MLIISVILVVSFNSYLSVAIYNSLFTIKSVTSNPSPHPSPLWLIGWKLSTHWPHYYFWVDGYAHIYHKASFYPCPKCS